MFARLVRSILDAAARVFRSRLPARRRRSHSLQLVDWLRDEPELGNGLLHLGRERRDDWQLCAPKHDPRTLRDALHLDGTRARDRRQEMRA